jgi:hypothetical protein
MNGDLHIKPFSRKKDLNDPSGMFGDLFQNKPKGRKKSMHQEILEEVEDLHRTDPERLERILRDKVKDTSVAALKQAGAKALGDTTAAHGKDSREAIKLAITVAIVEGTAEVLASTASGGVSNAITAIKNTDAAADRLVDYIEEVTGFKFKE